MYKCKPVLFAHFIESIIKTLHCINLLEHVDYWRRCDVCDIAYTKWLEAAVELEMFVMSEFDINEIISTAKP